MLEIIEEILELVHNYGAITSLITVIILLIILFYKKEFKKIWDALIIFFKNTKKTPSKVTDIDILNHEIFNSMDFWLYSKIPTLILKNEFRTEVFKEYLSIYLKSYKELLHQFVNSDTYKGLNNVELKKTLLELISLIIYDYETKMHENKIPEIVILKMKVINNDILNLVIDLTNNITNSDFYNSQDNLLKVYSFLNIIQSILENNMNRIEETFNSINGELKGVNFKGYYE